MFVGHFAIGFGAKRWAPKTSVGTLMFAALLADLLVFVFVAVGIEHITIRAGITRVNALNLYDFAWSHSLVMDVVWGALLAAALFPNSPLRARRVRLVRRCSEPLGPRLGQPQAGHASGARLSSLTRSRPLQLTIRIIDRRWRTLGDRDQYVSARDAHAPLRSSSRTLDIHCGVHFALVTQLQRRATTKRPHPRDGRSHPLPDRARLGILDRSFATAEQGLRARITGYSEVSLTQRGGPGGGWVIVRLHISVTQFRFWLRLPVLIPLL
jgi:hypothetical protein